MAKFIIGLVVLFAFKAFSAEENIVEESDNAISKASELSSKQLEAIKKSLKKALTKTNESV